MVRPGSTLRLRWRLIPLLMLVLLWLPGMNQGGYRVDTGLYAAVSLYAWTDGTLFPLMAGETPYFNKPPLVFWIHGFFLKHLGTELWVARLPSLMAALMCVWAVMGAVRELSGPRVALTAGMVLVMTAEFSRYTKSISLDMWMVLWFMLAVWFVARAVRLSSAEMRGEQTGGGWSPWVLIGLSGLPVGLALMTKPLVGLMLYPILGLWLALSGQWRLIGWLFLSIVMACAVAAPWHIAMYHTFGNDFISQYFGKQILDRAMGETFEVSPWWYYFKMIGTKYWPWLLCVVGCLLMRKTGSVRREMLLPLVWIAVYLFCISIFSGKSGRYAIALYPMMAWLSALWLVHGAPRWVVIVRRALTRWLVPVGAVLSVLVVALGVRVHAPNAKQWVDLEHWSKANNSTEVWSTNEMLWISAFVYVHSGRWLRIAPEAGPDAELKGPPAQSLMLFHSGKRLQARPAEREEIWRSGAFYVVRTATVWDGEFSRQEGER